MEEENGALPVLTPQVSICIHAVSSVANSNHSTVHTRSSVVDWPSLAAVVSLKNG